MAPPLRGLPAQLEHSQNWCLRALAQRLRQSDFRLHIQERIVSFLERVHFHEPALTAEAIVRWPRNECLIWNLLAEPMQQAGFGYDDDLACGRLFTERHHFFG